MRWMQAAFRPSPAEVRHAALTYLGQRYPDWAWESMHWPQWSSPWPCSSGNSSRSSRLWYGREGRARGADQIV